MAKAETLKDQKDRVDYDSQQEPLEEKMAEPISQAVSESMDFPEEQSISLVLDHKAEMLRLIKAIREANSEIDIRRLPLSYMAENQTDVIVHPNVLLDLRKPFGLEEVLSPSNFRSSHSYVFSSFRSQFDTETKDERKRQRWRKIDGILSRKETTTIARFLRNHLQLTEHGLKDDQIRDMAQRIEYTFKPTGLIFCDSIERYCRMFQVEVKTCMAPGSYHFNPIAKEINELGYWPSVWFLYNPQTQGVFIEKDGTPVARAFLIRDKATDEFKQYLNVMGITPGFKSEMIKLLEEAGYKKSPHMAINLTETFDVDPIQHNGKRYCPLPFHGRPPEVIQTGSYYLEFNQETGHFKFGPASQKPKKSILVQDPYQFHGYVCEDQFK